MCIRDRDETAGTMNDSWGFRYYDQNWKTPEAIAENRKKLNSLGVNYLLNMGNNRCENALRPLVISRKNMLFGGNHEAAENTAIILSLIHI